VENEDDVDLRWGREENKKHKAKGACTFCLLLSFSPFGLL